MRLADRDGLGAHRLQKLRLPLDSQEVISGAVVALRPPRPLLAERVEEADPGGRLR